MSTLNRQAKAFTMIELVLVVVVLGILAVLALPRMERDLRQEAADNILSAIRYTQHLALTDDKTDPTDLEWQKKLWSINFTVSTTGSYYTVSSNLNGGKAVNKKETAIDPANGKYMYHNASHDIQANESPNILIGKKYGINTVNFDNCKTIANGTNDSSHIAFDQQGRAHKGVFRVATNDYRTVMTDDCEISFGFEDGSDDLKISIARETGYAFIVEQEDS